MEQSVCISLPVASPIVHMLLNSPVTARAAVVILSKKAPATADLRYALTMVSSLGGFGGTEAPAGRPGLHANPNFRATAEMRMLPRLINYDQPNSFRPFRGPF